MSLAMVAALSRGGNKRDDGRDPRMEDRGRYDRYDDQKMPYDRSDMNDPREMRSRYAAMDTGPDMRRMGGWDGGEMNDPNMRRMGGTINVYPSSHMPWYPPYGKPWPMGNGDDDEPEMVADNITPIEDYRRIGFGSEMRRQPRWENGRYKPRGASMHYGDDEPEQMKFGGVIGINHENGKGSKLTKAQAEEWVESMENDSEQKPKGGMFSWEVARDWAQKVGIQPTGQRMIDFYAAMNAMYSDYSAVAARYKVDAPEFYAHMAKAFIDDPDAVKNKTAMYYRCIVEK